jgi:quinol monooxygenase YgiN
MIFSENRYPLFGIMLYRAPAQGSERMITEIAQIEAGVAKAAPVFKRAKGCHGLTLEKSIEKPSRYRLFVQWETVENHTVDFRGSADFQEWRACVGQFFESPPVVEHTAQVFKG